MSGRWARPRAWRGGGTAPLAAALIFGWNRQAHGDPGALARGAGTWNQWTFELPLLVALAIAWLVHVRGVRRLRSRSAQRPRSAQRSGTRSVRAHVLGLALVLLALASPLDALSEALVSAHMVQHLVLVACAAPLLAWGRPSVVALHGLPGRVRAAARRLAGQTAVRWVLRGVRAPLGALLAHTVALWFWHIPGFYEAALRVPALHWLQHLTFLGTALVYWGAVWHGRRNGGVVLLLLFAGATQGVLLGALLTLAPAPWYQLPDAAAGGFGLDPLDDQRLAGLLMWVPGAAVYLGAALFVGASWLARAEGAVRRGEGSRRVRQQRQWAGGP